MTEHRISQRTGPGGRKCWIIEALCETTGLWGAESSPTSVYYSKYAAKKALQRILGHVEDIEQDKGNV